ncbi:MAG TPA: HAMP domain-containing sensor histidine kinase [Thermoanaerobaculia bacterium]
MIRRPFLVAAAFVVSTLVLFGALARITAMALALERSERMALQRATEEENIRIALWRIDATLTELIALENTRPSARFRSAAESAGLPASPVPLVRARFEIGADRKLRSEPRLEAPTWLAALPIPEQPPRTTVQTARATRRTPPRPAAPPPAAKEPEPEIAEAVKPSPPEAPPPAAEPKTEPKNEPATEEGEYTILANMEAPPPQQQAAQQRQQAPPQKQLAVPQKQQIAPQELEKIPTARDPWAVLQTTPGVLVDRINVGGNESGQQSQYVQSDLNLQAFERRRELGRQTAFVGPGSTPPATPGARVEEIESAFEARWLGDDLVLLRRIRRGDERLLQGTVLDWPELRGLLLDRVEPVVPASRLEAVGENDEVDPGRRLALMPARLVPGPMPETEPIDWTPLRLSIVAAWVAALLGLVGIGSLLKGAVTLSQRRADFVSAVTHELRTPLTTFRLYTEMLADDMVPAEERPTYLATLKREADRLGHLIANVLAFSRLERRSAAAHVESVSLGELLEPIVPRLEERAAQEGHTFQVEIDPELARERVRVDRASVEQILFNLVDNACKYAPNPAQPALQLTASPGGRFIVIRLHDYGPGIERRERRRIFRPFHRSAARAAGNAPGVGLGLALSRRLARQMGGDLRLAGSEEGASFEVWVRRG